MPITPVNISIPLPSAPAAAPPKTAGTDAFAQAFADAVTKVEAFQQNAATSVNRFFSGEGEELHKVALDGQQAQLAFDLFMQVRNKVVAAYQEVMRMQV